MKTITREKSRFAKRFPFIARAPLALALTLVGVLVGLLPTLTACSQQSQQEADRQADSVKSDLEKAGHDAGEDLQQAGDKIGDGLEKAGRETSKQLEKAGERVQPYVEDAALTARVKTRLAAHPDLNPFQIDVDTVDGVVTLNGKVPTQADHDAALEVARNTEGVVKVVDNLQIGVRGE